MGHLHKYQHELHVCIKTKPAVLSDSLHVPSPICSHVPLPPYVPMCPYHLMFPCAPPLIVPLSPHIHRSYVQPQVSCSIPPPPSLPPSLPPSNHTITSVFFGPGWLPGYSRSNCTLTPVGHTSLHSSVPVRVVVYCVKMTSLKMGVSTTIM